MPSNYVQSGQVLGFKTGPQSAVDSIIAAGTGAVHGSFYLTQDSHRLYIGNEDGSLSAVNEGVVTVADLTALGQITPSAADSVGRKARTGQFVYITAENILAVYNGSDWVRINLNQNTAIDTFTIAIDSTNDLVQASIHDRDVTGNSSQQHTYDARFKVVGGDGAAVSYGSTNVTINGNTVAVPTITVAADYEISAVTESNKVKVKLTSNSDSNVSSSFAIESANDSANHNNVTITNNNGDIQIASRDTRNSSMSITNAQSGGFTIGVTDNFNGTVSQTFAPKIQHGVSVPVTVDFENGTAVLNAYTADEIDDLLTGLNAMTYIGTYAPSGNTVPATAIDSITVTGTTAAGNREIHASLLGDDVGLHIGDTILVNAEMTKDFGDGRGSIVITKGSLLIARGTEGSDGVITPGTLTFDIVESTNNTDTTYHFTATTNNDGVQLSPTGSNSTSAGSIVFANTANTDTATNNLIKASVTYVNDGTGSRASVNIQHTDVTRSDTTGTAVTQNAASPSNSWSGSTTFSVVSGVTTNESGHVTGVETKSVTLNDTATYFPAGTGSSVTTTAHNGTNNKKVGVIANTTTLTNSRNQTSTTTSYAAITSQSLTISDDDTQKAAASGANADVSASGLNIEMVWGSFGS